MSDASEHEHPAEEQTQNRADTVTIGAGHERSPGLPVATRTRSMSEP
jgi:hypothetical protein